MGSQLKLTVSRKRLLFILGTLLFLFGSISSTIQAQQTAKYKIKVKTMVVGGWPVDVSASGNDIFMKLMSKNSGTTISTDYFLFGREPGPGKWTETAFEYIHRDIGVIEAISIKLGNIVILDSWWVEAVEIDRQIQKGGIWVDDGKTTFNIKKEIIDKPSTSVALKGDITPSSSTRAIKDGAAQYNETNVTIVNIARNFDSGMTREMLKFEQKWTTEESISVTTGKASESSSFASLNYESPSTFFGTFGGQVGGAYNKTVTTEQTSNTSLINSSSLDWSYMVDPYSGVFRKINFVVPHRYQQYKLDSKSFVIKSLSDVIKPTSEDILVIPKKMKGKIVPVLRAEIIKNWLPYMNKKDADDIRNKELDEWIAEGWVVRTKAELGGNAGAVTSEATKKEVTAAKGSKKKTAPLLKGEYRIKSRANNKFLHENGLGDKLVSTRQGSTGNFTRYIFIRQSDGSYKIKAKGSNRFLHLASNWDKILSTRLDGPEENLRFIMELQNDNSYRIKSKANGRYLHLAAKGDKLVSTRVGSTGNDTKFILVKQK